MGLVGMREDNVLSTIREQDLNLIIHRVQQWTLDGLLCAFEKMHLPG